MNMRIIMTRIVALVSLPMSTVLNPAVRGVIDWKRESSNCVGPGDALQDMVHLEKIEENRPRQR